jgi:minor extracellular serine protease Vpr
LKHPIEKCFNFKDSNNKRMMMNKLFCMLAVVCLCMQANAQDTKLTQPKLSPVTRMLLKDMAKQPGQLPDGYVYKKHNGRIYFSGLAKVVDANFVSQRFEVLGVMVGTKAGDIWTMQVPMENLKAVTEIKGISYIQLDEPLQPHMDRARKATRVDSVHMGYNLPWPYSGQGVVMGIIDFGFDYGHPTFFDTFGTGYRVKRVWELNTTGTPPAGFSYGHELAGDAAIQAQGTDNPEQMHGTSVAGIAAGSGFGVANGKLLGVAFRSDMVLVGVRRDTIGDQWMQGSFSDFVDGVNYIFSYASSVNKPCVINISWGSQSGPHDGSTLFNQACNNLSGPGKIIVMSAGNEGEEHIHLGKTFNSSINDTLIQTFTTFSSNAYKRTWVDIWGEPSKTFCAKVTLYQNGLAGNTTDFYCIDDQTHNTYILGANGTDTCFVDFITSSAEFNNKPRVTVQIFNKAGDSVHVAVKGTDGVINMWDESYYYGYKYGYSSIFESLNLPGAVNGNNSSTVSDMGSAQSVLLVGAYASKTDFIDINNQFRSYSGYVANNNLVPFSSRGPMADGRIKPDIAAPGLTIATAVSSFTTKYSATGSSSGTTVSFTNFGSKKYYNCEFIGTSASSPVAAGIVALMLEANPRLTPVQVHDIVAQTAIKDNFTGAIPAGGNNNWGNGKINAYGAARAALALNSVHNVTGAKMDCNLYPNPNNGSFSLSYTAGSSEQLKMEVLDMTGRKLMEDNWQVKRGKNERQVELAGFVPGYYIVKLTSQTGTVSLKTAVE